MIDNGSVFDNTKHDPANIPELLSNLYKCLKHNPKFKDDKIWDELPTLAELQEYLFDEIVKTTPKGCSWSYNYDKEGNVRFLHYKELNDLADTFVLPLEWLHEIKYDSRILYELTVDMLAAIAKEWNLDVIFNSYNDMIIDDPDSYFNEDGGQEHYSWLRDIALYQKGGAAFLFRNTLRNRKVDKADLFICINKFQIEEGPLKGNLRNLVVDWLKKGIIALQVPAGIGHYYFPNLFDTDDGDPINVNDMFAYNWSFVDKVHLYAEDYINMQAQESGLQAPTVLTEYFPDKAPVLDQNEQPLRDLATFMEAGRQIYFDKFHASYKERRDNPDFDESLLINAL